MGLVKNQKLSILYYYHTLSGSLDGSNKGGRKFVNSPQTTAIWVAYGLSVLGNVPSKYGKS